MVAMRDPLLPSVSRHARAAPVQTKGTKEGWTESGININEAIRPPRCVKALLSALLFSYVVVGMFCNIF